MTCLRTNRGPTRVVGGQRLTHCHQHPLVPVFLFGLLGCVWPAMAWEPSEGSRSNDPGWYRSGESTPYAEPLPAPIFEPVPQSMAIYPGANPYQDSATLDWGRDGQGYSRQDQHNHLHDQKYRPDDGRGRTDAWPSHLIDVPGFAGSDASGYRFRDDDRWGRYWPSTDGRGGGYPGEDAAGYRFREDGRLNSGQQPSAGDPRYRFRPLGKEGAKSGSSDGRRLQEAPVESWTW